MYELRTAEQPEGEKCKMQDAQDERGRRRDGVIRVELPAHLQNLARVNGEVRLEVEGEPTLGAVLDRLEETYPVLCGAIRDHTTLKRRPFVRFFACEEDFSHEPPGTALPDAVASGREPLLIVGALAGG